MKSKNIIIVSILMILIFCIGVLCGKITNKNTNNNTEQEKTIQTDAKKFKEEYEKLNGTETGEDNEKYSTISISEDNPIVYVGLEELINIINSSEKSYIYVGRAKCSYCRAVIETLLEVAKSQSIDKIYYYDVSTGSNDIDSEEKRDELIDKLVEKGIVEHNENDGYVWGVPIVMVTQSGNVIDKQLSAGVQYNEDQTKNSLLTEEQKEILFNRYKNMFTK